MRTRFLALVLAVSAPHAVLPASAGQEPQPARTPVMTPAPGPGWTQAVSDLLTRRAKAVEQGDEAGFTATMQGASRAFVARSRRWFRAIRALPLATYDLVLSPHGYEDLAAALDERPAGDEVHVVQATERIALRRYDPRPSSDDVFLTVVRRGSRWSVVSDDDLDDLDVRSSRNLWDFGTVRRVERDGVMVLYHPDDRTAARRILDAEVDAVRRVRSSWPYRWPGRLVVMIPDSARELGRILQTTFDLGPFVAFAVSGVDRRDGYHYTGHRIYVQPETFFRYGEFFRAETLAHEALHVATRPIAGPFTPAWLDEGVAQVYGERGPIGVGELRARARSGRFTGRLPEDHEFLVESRSGIFLSYQASYDFISWLARTRGRNAGARLYRALGRKSGVAPGTWRYHLDRAARDAFGVSFRSLERAWAADVRRRFA